MFFRLKVSDAAAKIAEWGFQVSPNELQALAHQIKELQEAEAALKTEISRQIGDGEILEGDAAPGARIRIEVEDVRALCKALNAADYRHARPGCQDMEWGCTEMTINDPSGNRLTFWSPLPER